MKESSLELVADPPAEPLPEPKATLAALATPERVAAAVPIVATEQGGWWYVVLGLAFVVVVVALVYVYARPRSEP